MRLPPMPPLHLPFAPGAPVRSLQDVQRSEARPLAEALPVQSTYEIFVNSAAAFGDKTALTFLPTADPAAEPIRWSYAQLLTGIHQTANLLHHLGVGPEDAVAVLLPGCLEYHLALWGGEAAGIVQPLNPMLTDEKIAAMMTLARAKVLIAYGGEGDLGYWSKALRLRALVPSLTAVLRVAPHDEAPGAAPALPAGVLDLAARHQHPGDHLVSGRRIAATDIAAYFHTGGTTGAPKLARHSHGAQVFTAWGSVQMQGIRPEDVGINGYPLFHVAGVLPGSLCSLAVGMETVIPTAALFRNRDVIQNYWKLVEKHRSTLISGVPTALAALAAVPLEGADISSVRSVRTGAAPLPPELAARFERDFGLSVRESLGMTETAGLSTVTPPGGEAPAGCVGWPLPYARVRIVELDAEGAPTDREQPVGQSGMVLYRGPNLFSGYLDAAETAKAFTPDGWLITGDLGFRDAQGRLNLSGRAKDLIIRGGHNIDPKVIEDALGAHPAVHLCAAVGAPDAYAGELPVAFATLLPGATATEADLLAFTAARVDEAPAKPRSITILDHMPVTNVGKIYKPELRTLAAGAVVQALVDQVGEALGLAADMRPGVLAKGDGPVRVRMRAGGHVQSQAEVDARLSPLLEALPVKVFVDRN